MPTDAATWCSPVGQGEGGGQRGQDAVGDRLGVGVRRHLVAQHGEGGVAQAGDRVRRAHHGPQALAGQAQERVARRVAEGVVDELEAVQRDAEDGEPAAGAGQAREGVVEAVGQQRAVGQARDDVVHRAAGERGLRAPALHGVAQDAGYELGVGARRGR